MTDAPPDRSHAEEEISTQPACWERAARLADGAVASFPRRGARVAAVGCGSSYNLAKFYARCRESAGAGESDAFPASELPSGRAYDHYVFFSRTGTTTETLAAIEAVGTTPTTAITAVAGSPLAVAAGDAVVLDFADELAVVTTRFLTSAVALLRASLGEEIGAVVEEGREALLAPLPEADAGRPVVFLGRGAAEAIADEATLKLRETAQVWSESYNAMEYRHGPISIAEPGVLVWCLGEPPPGLEEEIRATGARFEHHPVDPLAELVRAQRLAVALATRKGRSPDAPRHLRRSIVLGGAAGG